MHAEPGFDAVGSVFSALGFGAFVFALIEGRSYGWMTAVTDGSLLGVGWTTGGASPVPVALAISVLGLVGLAVVETHRRAEGRSVLIDTSLFLIRSFGLGSLAAMILSLGEFGVVISVDMSADVLVACLVVYGVGVGFASAQLTSAILADVPVRQSGQASGTQSTARQVGSALGTAVLSTILFVGLAHDTEARVAEIPGVSADQAAQVAQAVQSSAGTAIPSLAGEVNGPALVEAASHAFADSPRRTAFTGAGFVAFGLIATLLLPADRRRDERAEPADEAGAVASAP